ncbi:MAG: Flp family type IVb pilin [Sphingomonas sp.]|nr:Flp family type IVb pilin [Sphingomonas sp.]
MRALLRRLLIERRAATAVEYGLIVSLVVIAMIASLQALAGQTVGMWNNVSTRVTQATGG